MGSALIGIAVTGLNAAQGGLTTTGHNIANVNTQGYSRQQAVQATNFAEAGGAGYFGRGVNIETVTRAYEQFTAAQTWAASASANHWGAALAQLQSVDQLVADPDVGIPPALDRFFSSLHGVATNPSDPASRQSMLSQAQGLASRFRDLDEQMVKIQQGTDRQILGAVSSINTLAASIAAINDKIALSKVDGDHSPNDLLDQRDAMLHDLNGIVRASAVQQGDGAVNVFLGNGQALVVGTNAFKLGAAPDSLDPERISVGLQMQGGATVGFRASSLEGGKLGGLLAFRDGTLDAARNALGRVAIVFASAFNQQHRLGLDRSGQPGGDFFAAGLPRAVSTGTNAGTAQLSASVTNFSALTESDYRVLYDGTNWNVTRLSDSTVQTFGSMPATIDGVAISVASGSAAAGDTYLIKPTRDGAAGFAVLVTQADRIAAAAPIRTAVANGNAGSASISAGTVNGPTANANLMQPVTLTFSGPGAFNVSGIGTGNPGGVVYTAGATISYNGWSAQISGTPAAGDVFTISPNAGGTGDNRNILLLAGLQTSALVGGSATLGDTYGQLVSRVGNSTSDAELSAKAQARIRDEAESRQTSISGVNLDEEAANLLRYQQAYQAAGKLVTIANSMFDTLLNLRT